MADYKTMCTILAQLWNDYRDEKEFKEFINYNDLGLPLAYCLAEGLVEEITEDGQLYVNESFNLFIAALGLDPDRIEDGTSLEKLLEIAENNQK